MIKLKNIRRKIYNVQFKRFKNSLNIRSPYTFLKSIYYIETASLFLFITQKIIKSPNFVTILYILVGTFGAFLINHNDINIFYIGIFMVFTKGTFDWADGALARRLNKTSFLGHALDVYGAHFNDTAFRIAFCYYVIQNHTNYEFIFPILAFILSITKFNLFCDFQYFKDEQLKKKISYIKTFSKKKFNKKNSKFFIFKIYYDFISFLDARARSIDFLLLILFIDRCGYFDLSVFLVLILFLIVFRELIIYLAGIYKSYKEYEKI